MAFEIQTSPYISKQIQAYSLINLDIIEIKRDITIPVRPEQITSRPPYSILNEIISVIKGVKLIHFGTFVVGGHLEGGG